MLVLFGVAAIGYLLLPRIEAQRPQNRDMGGWINHDPLPDWIVEPLLDLSNWKTGIADQRFRDLHCEDVLINTLRSLGSNTHEIADRYGDAPDDDLVLGTYYVGEDRVVLNRWLTSDQIRRTIIHEGYHSAGGELYEVNHPRADASRQCLEYDIVPDADSIPLNGSGFCGYCGLDQGEYLHTIRPAPAPYLSFLHLASGVTISGTGVVGKLKVVCEIDGTGVAWPACPKEWSNR